MAYTKVMTNDEFVQKLKGLTNRRSIYCNTFPYNLLYYDESGGWVGSGIISADCWNLIKALIWDPTIDSNYINGRYARPNVAGTGLEDTNADGILEACRKGGAGNVSSDFSVIRNIPIGAFLYYKDGSHAGVYIGTGDKTDGTGYVVESTPKWSNGIQITEIKSVYDATRGKYEGLRYKGKESSGSWTWWGKLPWIDYTVQDTSDNKGGASKELTTYAEVGYEEVPVTYTKTELNTVDTTQVNLGSTKTTSLLSYPTLVESPFVIMEIGDYTFGSYSKASNGYNDLVQYPNYIQGMTVKKINNAVNQYTINLHYQIQAGQDPNFIDKIFSSVGYGKIKLKYGDWMAPHFVYEVEEALITKVSSKVSFSTSSIDYTVNATSTISQVFANNYKFEKRSNARPSDVIIELFQKDAGQKYGLSKIFTGMDTIAKIRKLVQEGLNDKPVHIQSKEGIDVLSYINYLVTCMSSSSNDDDSVIRDSSYYMSIHDSVTNEYGGSYFKIHKVDAKNFKVLANENIYEVNVGYSNPQDQDNALVISFDLNTDNSWSLLYNYSMQDSPYEYTYTYDNNGNLVTNFSPSVSTSTANFMTNESQRNWWTQMTQFPVSATLVIKGLLRPTLLMTKIKVNSYFYGKKHTSSGIYVITEQTDSINASGYRTTLKLQRVAGDNDYYSVKTLTENRKYVKLKRVTTHIDDWTDDETINKGIIGGDVTKITYDYVGKISAGSWYYDMDYLTAIESGTLLWDAKNKHHAQFTEDVYPQSYTQYCATVSNQAGMLVQPAVYYKIHYENSTIGTKDVYVDKCSLDATKSSESSRNTYTTK